MMPAYWHSAYEANPWYSSKTTKNHTKEHRQSPVSLFSRGKTELFDFLTCLSITIKQKFIRC